jgi:hypothetical protein
MTKRHFTDLTAIDCSFGELDDDTQARLRDWTGPLEAKALTSKEWTVWFNPVWSSGFMYRAKPQPAPVKEVGTLAEIGAQVGDVVEYTAIGEPHFIARSFTFAGWHYGIPYDIDMKIGGNSNLRTDDECKFRIIRRASDAKPEPQGPVITETVKRIVPGVYGAVGVQDGCLVNVAYMRTAPELRAAIATLTEIADALEGGAK